MTEDDGFGAGGRELPEDVDCDGWETLDQGCGYYNKGMSYTDAADHEKRIECFQAAETLYRRAAEKGNPMAFLNLGYVYSYDRCEGHYQQDCHQAETDEDNQREYPREQRAFECFSRAAELGLAEGGYKLGDLYKKGIGCEPDAKKAFECYKQASELDEGNDPVVWGSIALRLADSFENGFGCAQDFTQAHEWYKKAEVGLDLAVRKGERYYGRVLVSAKAGVKRTEQELTGGY